MELGPQIPHSESTEKAETRGLLLLILFKPWREVTDLKSASQATWSEALTDFEEQCSQFPVELYFRSWNRYIGSDGSAPIDP